MKKLTKIGLSALCGSLASVTSAFAGTIDVLGNAHATLTHLGNTTTGNPLGMKTNLSFVGNGELDGGQKVNVTIAHTDQNAWSSAGIKLDTNSLGSWKISSAEGSGGLGGYDDNMPRAFEEVWDSGVGTNINLAKGVGSSMNLQYTTPAVLGAKLIVAWAPNNDGAQVNDKATSGGSDAFGTGFDVVLDVSPSFGQLFLGYSQTEIPQTQNDGAATKEARNEDQHREVTAGLQAFIGPIKLGGQASVEHNPESQPGKVEYYGTTSWGVSFNVNDDLSLSYGEVRQTRGYNSESGNPRKRMKGDSLQIAYTIGGIALKYADTSFSNTNWTDANDKDAKILSMSMAF